MASNAPYDRELRLTSESWRTRLARLSTRPKPTVLAQLTYLLATRYCAPQCYYGAESAIQFRLTRPDTNGEWVWTS